MFCKKLEHRLPIWWLLTMPQHIQNQPFSLIACQRYNGIVDKMHIVADTPRNSSNVIGNYQLFVENMLELFRKHSGLS